MTKHYKIYSEYFDYATPEEIMCEACGSPAVDIHHIQRRGVGRDVIENLIALCRKHHEQAHFSRDHVTPEEFQMIHRYFMNGSRKIFLK